MDALDLRILATMGYTPWGPRPQDPAQLRASTLARQLDLTPETVRERLSSMEDAGVIQAWEAYPNPQHADLQLAGYAFQPPNEDTAETALNDVLLVDGVVEVLTYHGPFVVVALTYQSDRERDRRLDLIKRLLDAPAAYHVFDPPLPDPTRELDVVDWRLIQALRGQARRALREVADELSVSYRTVKRRYNRMTNEGSLFVVPRVDLSRVAGILPFTLVAMLSEDATMDTVNAFQARFDDRILHRLLPQDPAGAMAAIGCYAETLSEMDDLKHEATTLDGVERVLALLSKGRKGTQWIDDRINERIQAEA